MEQLNLFEKKKLEEPLASRLRPANLEEFVGQEHLVGEGKVLRRLIEEDRITSMVFWGPPGVGKTTLARIIAQRTKAKFIDFSAVTSGIKEIKAVMEEADEGRRFGEKTILFVDEIHRFNKAQQDAFLPYVEKGAIILIGATTENPSFEINSALLSRCKVFVLKALEEKDIVSLLKRAIEDERGFGARKVKYKKEDLEALARFANGDARMALSTLEMVINNADTDKDGHPKITRENVEQCTSRKSLLYDKKGEEHYNIISALHKSMRNSDPDAAVYWLARILEAGEDPLYVARRLIRFASEDVGLADPRALELCVAAYQACHYIGMPECTVNLTQAVVYLAMSPKSNALDVAYIDLDYGKGYKYAHDFEEKITAMVCLPENLEGHEYYHPTEQGLEGKYKARLEQIKAWKKEHKDK